MFSNNLIKKVLCDYIKDGNKNFIIYPFGDNGILVKNILQEYFNIIPRLIVDNTYSKYNSNLINFDGLKEDIHADDYVILTIENGQINKEMESQLEEIHEKNKIINLYDISNESYKATLNDYFDRSFCELYIGD